MNYQFTGGYFKGRACAEGARILDLPFAELPYNLQSAIAEFAGLEEIWQRYDRFNDADDRRSLDFAVKEFENSWDWQSEETESPIDLLPVSQWR